MININAQNISALDSKGMFDILRNFPAQVRTAIEIGKDSSSITKNISSNNILILGMGGSAIGGDILRSYCNNTKGADHLSIAINRSYDIPKYINSETFVIASSYSGGTEETLSGFQQALEVSKNILCISSGGELVGKAILNNIPVVTIPTGLMPRCAIGYSFFTMLEVLINSNAFKPEAIEETELAIEELLELLEEKSMIYSQLSYEFNPALNIASKIAGTIPIIYSSSERLDTTNLRWRGQIQENAKNLCFGNFLPEMNHNEINGWNYPKGMSNQFSVIFLKDKDDNKRVKLRFDALKSVLEEDVKEIISINSNSNYLLTRIFDLIYLADWVSFYLAMINNVDPTPIPQIMKLKNYLAIH